MSISTTGSSILMLRVDVEGFELNVLCSAEKLFREKRIHHFRYSICPLNKQTNKH